MNEKVEELVVALKEEGYKVRIETLYGNFVIMLGVRNVKIGEIARFFDANMSIGCYPDFGSELCVNTWIPVQESKKYAV